VTAERNGEFIEFDLDDLDEVTFISRSEEGVLAFTMYYLVEDYGGHKELSKSNSSAYVEMSGICNDLEFSRLDELIDLQRRIGKTLDCRERLLQYCQSIL